jgi:hypothetical protein
MSRRGVSREIDGKSVDYEPGMSFDGRVLQSEFGGTSVEVRALGWGHRLSF